MTVFLQSGVPGIITPWHFKSHWLGLIYTWVNILTTGLFVSGCYLSVIFCNKLPNFVLFHKCSFSLIVLKFSVKLYSKILEKLRCRGSGSCTTQCNGKMSEFQNSKFDLLFFHEPLPTIDSFKQVMKIFHLFATQGSFRAKLIC